MQSKPLKLPWRHHAWWRGDGDGEKAHHARKVVMRTPRVVSEMGRGDQTQVSRKYTSLFLFEPTDASWRRSEDTYCDRGTYQGAKEKNSPFPTQSLPAANIRCSTGRFGTSSYLGKTIGLSCWRYTWIHFTYQTEIQFTCIAVCSMALLLQQAKPILFSHASHRKFDKQGLWV